MTHAAAKGPNVVTSRSDGRLDLTANAEWAMLFTVRVKWALGGIAKNGPDVVLGRLVLAGRREAPGARR